MFLRSRVPKTALLALLLFAGSARADNIVVNQWYSGHFENPNSPVLGGSFALGTNGPILPSGTAGALNAPADGSGALSMVITLPFGGYLTVTDVEDSGDQFQIFVNAVAATPAPAGASGLVPGGQQAFGAGFTSVPAHGSSVVEDISAALANASFSSGTFYLPPGTSTITGQFLGDVNFGDVNLIVEATVPEPASIAVFCALAGAAWCVRRRQVQAG